MKKLLVLIVICFALGTIVPLFSSGLFPMHDNAQVGRVVSMHKALADGMFPVRWSEYLGYNYGYPIFNFYAPFAYYVGGLAENIVHDPVIATKIMMGGAMLLAGITMYFLARAVWGELSGLVAAVFYLYIPYHALNLYVRGAVSELWAYGFLPLPFYGLYKLYTTGKYRYFIVIAISYAAIILSHNLTALMVTPFLGVLIVLAGFNAYKNHQKRTAVLILGSLLCGVLLSAFYFIPALLEMSFTNVSSILGGGSNPLDHFICISQLWQSQWGFGGSAPGCVDGFSLMIGKLHILTVLAGVVVLIAFIRQKNQQKIVFLSLSLLLFFSAVFMTTDLSLIIWKNISVMQYFQFPWRFLSLVALSSSFIAGALVYFLNQKIGKYRIPLQYVLVLLIIISSIIYYGKYFKPASITSDSSQLGSPAYIAWDTTKISDEYMPRDFMKPRTTDQVPQMSITVLSGKVDVLQEIRKTQETVLTLTAQNAKVQLNLASFPAWRFFIDDKVVVPQTKRGLSQFDIPSGKHVLRAIFIETNTEKIANGISIVGVIILITGIIISQRRKYI